MAKIKQKILTVCHDAGGAEIVSAYVKKHLGRYDFRCLVLGPARTIFKRKGLGRYLIANEQKAKNIINKMSAEDLVLTGTSWASGVENECSQQAKRRGIRTATYLDHWTNYRERFGYPKENWRKHLPDEVWVGDKYAARLVKRYFKNVKYRLMPNLYWQEVKVEYKKLKSKHKKADTILFISEPIVSRDKFFNETDVLKKLLSYLSEKEIKDKIIICYHPSEPKDKYDRLLAQYKNKLNFTKQSKDRLQDFTQAKLVIGMKSMALVIARLCGKITVSFLPNRAAKCPLPFKDIIKIHNVKQLEKIIC